MVHFQVWTPHATVMGVRCILSHVDGWYETAEIIGPPEKFIGGG